MSNCNACGMQTEGKKPLCKFCSKDGDGETLAVTKDDVIAATVKFYMSPDGKKMMGEMDEATAKKTAEEQVSQLPAWK